MGQMRTRKTNGQIRSVRGLGKYYRDMWSRWSHLQQPLTTFTPEKVRFKCTYVEQKAFDDIKCMVMCDTLLTYPYFKYFFDIYTDAINYQLLG